MQIWKHSPADSLLLGLSVAQPAVTIWLATEWLGTTVWGWAAQVAGLAVMTAYNIIVISHLFTHAPWFVSAKLNAVVSVLNSVNIGQSVQAYQLTHVRNHHRFNNDKKGEEGTTRDTSSTYRDGQDGEHTPLPRYVIGGAWQSVVDRGKEVWYVFRLWRVGDSERTLLSLASRREPRRSRELRQIQVDRMAHVLVIPLLAMISWQWTMLCYLPGWFVALAMVNVQNYYRHYGADPDDRSADSVSHYGRLYNLLAFNDEIGRAHV